MSLNLIKNHRSIRERSIRIKLSINGREKVKIKKIKNPKTFIDYLQTNDDFYENLEDYNSTKKKSYFY